MSPSWATGAQLYWSILTDGVKHASEFSQPRREEVGAYIQKHPILHRLNVVKEH